MTPDEITALFDRRNAAMTSRDPDALAVLCTDDAVIESPTFGRMAGRHAILNAYRHWFRAFPDLIFSYGDLMITGDRVTQTMILEGTDTGGFLGQAPTGKPFRLFLVVLYALKDSKILHERRVYDVSGLLLQLAGDHGSDSDDAARRYRATLERTRIEHELKTAAAIQQALLPERLHSGAGFEVAAASVPCRAIGGDFFDYFDLSNVLFGFALGDVAGKGPAAALLAAEIQGILAGYSHSNKGAAATVTHVNRTLCRRVIDSRFATMLYGVLSCDGQLTYSNAGHNPPILVSNGRIRRLETGGVVLGAFGDAAFDEETIQLDPGDVLVVFSDGVTEAMSQDGLEFGDERLASCVVTHVDASPSSLLDSVLGTVREFTTGAAQSDDITSLVLRYTGS